MRDESFIQYLYELYLKDIESETDENLVLMGHLDYDGFKAYIKNSLKIR